jgi:hypothetical protein
VDDGDVLNYVTWVMKLTRGKLLQQDDWTDWQEPEYLQLDQYDTQGMFGNPVAPTDKDVIFHLVWTYAVKAVDGHKKARCVCDGSTCSGMVRVLAETYANCIDQTSARLFYAVAAAENLLVFGADVSNAFAEALPQNKDSSFALIRHSQSGGSNIKICCQFPQVMSSLFSPQCRDTLNLHVSGRNMPTKFSGKSGSHQPYTNHVSIRETLMDNGYSSCNKSMTLPLLHLMLTHQISS